MVGNGWTAGGGAAPGRGLAEDLHGPLDGLELGVRDGREERAQLARIELAEPLHELEAGRGGGHDDLAPVGGVVGAGGEAVVDELVDEAARGRRRDAQPGDELGHVDRAAGEHVEHLGLGHGDPDVAEVGGVLEDQELHQPFVGVHRSLDEGGVALGRPIVRVTWNVRCLRMVRCRRIISRCRMFVRVTVGRCPSRTIGR